MRWQFIVPHFTTGSKIYNDIGEANLIVSTKNKYYSDSLKLNAVKDYLDGKDSLKKYMQYI